MRRHAQLSEQKSCGLSTPGTSQQLVYRREFFSLTPELLKEQTMAPQRTLLPFRRRVVASNTMLWVLLITLALVKLTAASMMLWLPFRADSAVLALGDEKMSSDTGDDDEDGGSKVEPLCGSAGRRPRRPWPKRPRRGPHGSCPPESPPRVRTGNGQRQRAHARSTRAS